MTIKDLITSLESEKVKMINLSARLFCLQNFSKEFSSDYMDFNKCDRVMFYCIGRINKMISLACEAGKQEYQTARDLIADPVTGSINPIHEFIKKTSHQLVFLYADIKKYNDVENRLSRRTVLDSNGNIVHMPSPYFGIHGNILSNIQFAIDILTGTQLSEIPKTPDYREPRDVSVDVRFLFADRSFVGDRDRFPNTEETDFEFKQLKEKGSWR